MNPLAQILVQKGGYGVQDAINASNGPRASELAREFGVTGSFQNNANNTISGNSSSSSSTSGGGYSTGQAANDIKSQYSNLLGLLKGQSDTATASEYGKRGIPVSSGVVGNAQTQNYANAAGQLQLQESRDLAGLASDPTQSSSSSSGSGSGATSGLRPLSEIQNDILGGGGASLPQQTQAAPNYGGVQRLADGSPALLGVASQFTPSTSSGITGQEAATRAQQTGIEANQAQQSATALNKRSNLLSSVLNLPNQTSQSAANNPLYSLLNYRAY